MIHSYIILCWNLFARSCSVGKLRTSHKEYLEKHEQILNLMPTAVTNKILANVQVEGVMPITPDSLHLMLEQYASKIISEQNKAMQESIRSVQLSSTTSSSTNDNSTEQANSYYYDNMWHYIPEHWTLPRGKVRPICDMFMFGIKSGGDNGINIRPLRKCERKHMKPKDRNIFSKYITVFNSLVTLAINKEYLNSRESLNSLTISEWDDIFEKTYSDQLQLLPPNSIPKPGEINMSYYYDWVVKL